MRFNCSSPTGPFNEKIGRLSHVAFFSVIASLSLHLHFLSEHHDLWLLVALSFWWYLIDCKTLNTLEALLGSLILSVPFSSVIFESVLNSHPVAVFSATLMNVPQIFLPSLLYLRYKNRLGFLYGFLGMLVAWLLIAELRASPQLSNIFAVDSSLSLSLNVYSLLHSPHLPAAGTLLTLFAGSLSLLRFIFTQRLFDFIISGVVICILSIPAQEAPHAATPATLESVSSILQTSFSTLETISDHVQPRATHAMEYVLGALIQQASPATKLLVLPETVIRTPTGIRIVENISRERATPIIGGALTVSESSSTKAFNAALLFDKGEATGVFHKWQLIPFYESSIFHRGDFMTTIAFGETRVLGILICMDATFTVLAEQAIIAGATELIVLSASDYGFGYSTPWLQLSIAQRLAKRHSIPILLAATNGPSAFIDTFGNVNTLIDEGRQAIVNVGSGDAGIRDNHAHSAPLKQSIWPDISLCFIFLVLLLIKNRSKRQLHLFSIPWTA